MGKPEIKAEALKLETLVAHEQTNKLADELHSLPARTRAAVAKQIMTDQEAKSDPTLPKLEFAASGDLKSVDTKANGDHTHVEYNPSTGKLQAADESVHIMGMMYQAHAEYDSSTGKPVYVDQTDGSGNHTRFDFNKPQLYQLR